MTKQSTVYCTVKQFGEAEERILRFIGSTETRDRDGDVLAVDGWELANYLKNPVFLWAHDYSIPPIGKAINVTVRNKQLLFDIEFPEEGVYPLADTVYKLYRGGFLSATSVGFIGKDGMPIATGTHFTRQELLELSAVPVPSNPTALQQAKAKGFISSGAQKFFDDVAVIEIIDNRIEIDCTEAEVKTLVGQAVKNAIKGR